MSAFSEESRLFDGDSVTPESIDELVASQKSQTRSVFPIICAAAVISCGLSILGTYTLLPETQYLAVLAILLGFATALVSAGFWTILIRHADDAKTNWGITVYVALFLIGIFLVNAPSTITNYAGTALEAARSVDQTQETEDYAAVVNKTNDVATQLRGLRDALKNQGQAFNARYRDEVQGKGVTTLPREGHVSNALLAARNLISAPLASLDSALDQFNTLKTDLDTKLAAWQELQKAGDLDQRRFDKARIDVGAVISRIAAINPKAIGKGVADQIGINIAFPTGASRVQESAIRGIQKEIEEISNNLRARSQAFVVVEIPNKTATSNLILAWRNVFQFLPQLLLSVAIDLVSPLFFLIKLPGMLAIHAQRKALAARFRLIRNELAFHRSPKASQIMDMMLTDAEQLAYRMAAFQRKIVEMGVQGNPFLPLDRDFYLGPQISDHDNNNVAVDQDALSGMKISKTFGMMAKSMSKTEVRNETLRQLRFIARTEESESLPETNERC